MLELFAEAAYYAASSMASQANGAGTAERLKPGSRLRPCRSSRSLGLRSPDPVAPSVRVLSGRVKFPSRCLQVRPIGDLLKVV